MFFFLQPRLLVTAVVVRRVNLAHLRQAVHDLSIYRSSTNRSSTVVPHLPLPEIVQDLYGADPTRGKKTLRACTRRVISGPTRQYELPVNFMYEIGNTYY